MNKNFSLLLAGQSLANIGDVLYMVGIISMIFGLTGSATAASFVPFTITTSMFVSNLLTPLLIEKVNLKWLLVGSQLGKTILIIVLGLFLIGISGSNYYWIFLIISGIALLDGCANPIMHSMIPQYVKSDKLVQANGIVETVTQLIQTVMWFVGTLFLVLTSPQQIVWIVSLLFVVSSVLLCFLENVNQQEVSTIGRSCGISTVPQSGHFVKQTRGKEYEKRNMDYDKCNFTHCHSNSFSVYLLVK